MSCLYYSLPFHDILFSFLLTYKNNGFSYAISYILSFDWYLPPDPPMFPSSPSIFLSTSVSHVFCYPFHTPPLRSIFPLSWARFGLPGIYPCSSPHKNTYIKLEARLWENMWYLTFWTWIISFNILFSSFIHFLYFVLNVNTWNYYLPGT